MRRALIILIFIGLVLMCTAALRRPSLAEPSASLPAAPRLTPTARVIDLALIQRAQDAASHYMLIVSAGDAPRFRDVAGDGACGWRSLALALLHDEERYAEIRAAVGTSLARSQDDGAVIDSPQGGELLTRAQYGQYLLQHPTAKDLIHEAAIVEAANVYDVVINVHVFQKMAHKWNVIQKFQYKQSE